ncbi:MAG: ROK family protein, partial [Rubritalea sp.]|uniref:ROK family protein n=1 Tax=Rubritalea sp. TaxID=2109375 RepID=UPI003242FA3E
GMASGTALGKRWGVPAQELGREHEAWDLQAGYLAAMVQNLVACYAPERIILGGGVMEQDFLLEKVKLKYAELAGGYWKTDDSLLVHPALGNQAGIRGALLMARNALAAK